MSEDEATLVRRRLLRLFDRDARHEPGRPTIDLPPAPTAPRRGAAPRSGRQRPLAAGGGAGLALDQPVVDETHRHGEAPGDGGRSDALMPHTAAPSEVDLADEPEPEPSSGPSARRSRLPGPGAFDPGRRGVRALAAVAAFVVLIAGAFAWWSRPHAEPVGPVEPLATVAAPDGPPPVAVTSSAQMVVAVAGKVRRPGLVRLPAGSRLADAVEAAGGALPGVDVALLNPARKVADGELILVGVTAPPGQPAQPGQAAGPAAAGGAPAGPVNLNTATLAQLDALPGVGPVLAQRILDHRERHGGFRSVSDLRQVNGIGDARYEQLKDLVTV